MAASRWPRRLQGGGLGALAIPGCIVIAQFVMLPAALLVRHRADRWGRKPLFLIGFAALPVRGLLFALLGSPAALLGIQVLDGVGAGIFGALFPTVIADLTRGTGRYNLTLGAASACWGLGAAFSNGVAGVIVDRLGFSAAFFGAGRIRARGAGAVCTPGAGNPVHRMSAFDQRMAVILIFAAIYFVVAIGKLPVLRLDRAGAALLGAALMVASGVRTLEQAQHAIDLDKRHP